MTLEEILAGLEGLKDLTNDGGKAALEGLKRGVTALVESLKVDAAEEKVDEPVVLDMVEESEVEPEENPALKKRAYKRRK